MNVPCIVSVFLSFDDWMKKIQNEVEAALEGIFLERLDAARLQEAMRYALLNGGKRIRPLLVYAAAELFDAQEKVVRGAACAIEMIHTYSLVHDDMPCMDNDVLRRGKPTVHVQYDEATALLVGDALQTQAFLILSEQAVDGTMALRTLRQIKVLSQAAGLSGMCGGQAIDCESVGLALSLKQLEHMHRLKTGALLRAAVLLGAFCGKYLSDEEVIALEAYADAVGLAFQVVDDILDVTADSATLGKTAGKDAAQHKPTYVSLLGLNESKVLAEKLRHDAHGALSIFGKKANRLGELADLIVQRGA